MTAPASLSGLDAAAATAARWSARLGGAAVLGAALWVAAEVVVRNMPGNLTAGMKLHSFEITNWLFAASVAFGFAFALTERSHIRIDLLYAILPLPVRAALDAVSLLALAGMGCLMAWHGWGVVAASARLGAMPNSSLQVPLVIPQSLWALGLTWFAGVALLLAAQGLRRLLTGRFAELHALAGAQTEGLEDDAEGQTP
ncbi:MAG: TRAP transporter small permease [Pseudomonadota bacterium]